MTVTAKELNDLELFFKTASLPTSVQLSPGTMITHVPTFVESHLSVVRSSLEKPMFYVFYERLLRLKEIVEANLNDRH